MSLGIEGQKLSIQILTTELGCPGSPWVKYEGLECPAGGAASALASAGLGRGCRERGQNEGTHTQVFAWGVCISFACVHKCLCLNNFMIDSIIPCYGCEWKIHFLTFKTPGQKLQKKASVFISNIPSLLTHIPLSYNWKKSIILWSLSECLLTAFFPETRLRNFKVVLDYFVHGFLILSSKEH